MMSDFPRNLVLFDDDHWFGLLPLTFTRPICELRVGILTIKEKWEKWLDGNGSYITQDYLSEKFRINIEKDNILINSTFLPDASLVQYINELKINQAILYGEELIAARLSDDQFGQLSHDSLAFQSLKGKDLSKNSETNIQRITKPYHIFSINGVEIKKDFDLITKNRTSQPISKTNQIYGQHTIFLEEGAEMECCIVNTNAGPVYLGKNTVIMEGTMIRGGFAACEGSIVKMGAKIYGPTTMGPHCRLGGEVNNSVLLANSNKGHDGYLGNSVLGEWCNLGADTNTSNLKSNYSPIKLWSYNSESYEDSGLQFCGLIMGDHSKSSINTMFNTGTVVGVCTNVFGDGFPSTYIPSFSWGGGTSFSTHLINKALETAKIVFSRRNQIMSQEDKDILIYLFENTTKPL